MKTEAIIGLNSKLDSLSVNEEALARYRKEFIKRVETDKSGSKKRMASVVRTEDNAAYEDCSGMRVDFSD